MNKYAIILKGIQVNNLKNIDVEIPRDQLVVVTGLSGSGKSSLVFDTIYAEGQRRYAESLNAYVRQFLGKAQKPVIEYVSGIPPAIAIEQKVATRNPRSTLGTTTEIYEYIKLLFARLGKTYSPVSGKEVKRDSVSDVADFLFQLKNGTRIMLLAPLFISPDRTFAKQMEILLHQGFSRIYYQDKMLNISENRTLKIGKKEVVYLLVDRCTITANDENKTRIVDSIETAYFQGDGYCEIVIYEDDGSVKKQAFSNKFECDGMAFRKPSVNMFTFSNSYGACPVCNGLGESLGISPDLVIPDRSLSVYDDAVVCWKGEKMSEFKQQLLDTAYKFKFPIHKPIRELSQAEYDLLWTGNNYFAGINRFFQFVEENMYKIQYRVMYSRYRGKTICPECKGSRLAKDADYVKIAGLSINQVCNMTIEEALPFFHGLHFENKGEAKMADFLIKEIVVRLQFLADLGLPYLTLNRPSATLSGGEFQRVNLGTALGSSLVGSLYILDEPSIGLHSVDTQRLIKLLKHLRDIGNTVLVVEHDEDIIKEADYIIDVGPYSGQHGGEIVFQGTFEQLKHDSESITAQYLSGKQQIPQPKTRRKSKYFIKINGACLHNLQNIDVTFPLGTFTAVTGVSGSGKTSLVKGILYAELKRHLEGFIAKNEKTMLSGNVNSLHAVEFVDQNPIGRSSRSNPATYIGAFDFIRQYYAEQQLSKFRGYKPGFFSLNVEGGRCEVCQGEGKIRIGMQFMSDVEIVCDNCKGNRYSEEVFDVKIAGKTIADVLNFTVEEAIAFFSSLSASDRMAKNIVSALKPLQDVGLDYLQLGQSSSSLSGGEAQRVKLASFLGKSSDEKKTLFIFDEPTTGLHYHDINKLYQTFQLLVDKGNTVLVIEHNLELIKCADWIIDLGPEGGKRGGQLVFAGTPEEIIHCKNSATGQFLKGK